MGEELVLNPYREDLSEKDRKLYDGAFSVAMEGFAYGGRGGAKEAVGLFGGVSMADFNSPTVQRAIEDASRRMETLAESTRRGLEFFEKNRKDK